MRLQARASRVSLPALSMPQLWALTALAAVFVTSGLTGIWLGDFWWHLKVGQVIAGTGQIPVADTFSFVASGRPYLYGQWLGELYLYSMYSLGGLELAVLANTLLLTATAMLVLLAAWERSHKLRIAAACTVVGMYIALSSRDVRPQTLGFLFFAVYYLLLMHYRQGRVAPLWLLPPLAAIWANVHGSAVLGFGLAAAVCTGELLKAVLGMRPGSALPWRKLVALGLTTVAIPMAMLLNPWGSRIFEYWLTIQRNPVVQNSSMEWFAPTFRDPQSIPFFLALLAGAAIFALSPEPLDLTDVILFVVFAALALQAVRNAVWFGIVATPLAAGQVAAVFEHWRMARKGASGSTAETAESAGEKGVVRSEALANYVFAALVVGLAALTLPWVKPNLALPAQWRGLIAEQTPVAAVRFIAARFPEERFFHPDIYGSYMIWATAGRPPVFVDGRIELYPVEVWQEYIEISLAQGWEKHLADYGIRHVLLAKQGQRNLQQPLLEELRRSPGWEPVYEDEQAIVFVRKS